MPNTIVTDTLHEILEDAVEGVITTRLGDACEKRKSRNGCARSR
jgi:hypothetical protein